ncbi:helix-turn-helix transcriptional regulator [Haladaptatus halobius]|uniref:helix-turn-helix transcriptional regulator n=1 Tax=Haladaptatus halobius TaxID=2884875 RepID=UPI003F5FE06B
MYQQEILRVSNWSDSKLSNLLSEMEFEGHITRIHVGREKIVFLADHGPDTACSSRNDKRN